jgi:hypothetical protein
MVETPEAFVTLLEESRPNWKPGYRLEQDVMVSLHRVDIPNPLIQIRNLVQKHGLPFVVDAVPGPQTRHPDKFAALSLFRATYISGQ